MNKKMNFKKISAVGASVVMAVALAFGVGFGVYEGFAPAAEDVAKVEGGGTEKVVSNYAASGNTVIPSATPSTVLGTFAEGSKYFYTNYVTGIAISDGTSNAATDMEVVTVANKSSNAAGTKLNPYVINSKSDWNVFATQISKNYGASQYFVLNCDLDYNTAAEGQPVARSAIARVETFKGTFYGNGHTIKNITYAKSSATAGVDGLFTLIQNATICDLGIQNYYCNNNNKKFGALAGRSLGNNYIVACKAQGEAVANASAVQMAQTLCCGYAYHWYEFGGLVGHACGNTNHSETIYFYKCAATSKFTEISPNQFQYSTAGGLVSHVYLLNARIYDCFTSIDAHYHGYTHSGGITGGIENSGTTNLIKNCVCIVNFKNNEQNYWDSSASPYYNGSGKLAFNNIYAYSNFNANSALYATRTNVPTAVSVTSGSVHTTSDYTKYVTGNPGGTSPAVANSETLMTTANFWTALKDTSKNGLNPKIWNVSVFDGATMSPTKQVDVFAVSPQISKTRIEFKNTDGTNCALAGSASSEAIFDQTQIGAALPRPASQTGKEFDGWSLDKASDSPVYEVFPANLYGNVTMYPVYNMTGVTVSVKAEVAQSTQSNGEVSDENVTAKYIGEGVVTLKAKITAAPADLEKCKVVWSWYKSEGGSETKLKEAVSTEDGADTLVLTELTSAKYYAKVSIVSNDELWRTDPTADVKWGEFNVTIEKGVLSPSGGITLQDTYTAEDGTVKDVFAYWGQSLNELTDFVSAPMKNTGDNAVSGTITWVPLKDGSVDTVKGTQQTFAALFHPDDLDHYVDNTPINVTVTPTLLTMVYEFRINEQISKTFTFTEKYGTVYKKGQIADRFEEEYFEYLDELSSGNTYNEIVGRMPYFGTENILQYRQSGDDAAFFDADHVADDTYIIKNKVQNTAVLTIPVVFNTRNNSTNFTVALFNTEVNGNLEKTNQSLGYGELVQKPAATLHNNSGTMQYLKGWFVANSDGTAGSEVWDFASDRVTGAFTLSAVWADGYLKLDRITARVNGDNRVFTARSTPKTTDYVVTGIYKVYGDAEFSDDKHQEVELVLSSDDYTVAGEGSFGYYHVHTDTTGYESGKNDRVVVTAKSDNSKTDKVDVAVNPMRVDLSGVNFPNQSVVYTGAMQTVSKAEITFREDQVISSNEYTLVYEYWSSGDEKLGELHENDPGIVKEVGIYYVRLRFDFSTASTADLVADKVSATFTITEQQIEVFVSWNADNQKEYVYNGQIQHPEASFYRKGESGEDIPVTITFAYTGNFEQKNANADGVYSRVNVVLRNSRYQFAKTAVTSLEFRINRAKVPVPQLSNNSFEYKAENYDISQYLGYDADTLQYLVEVRNGTAKDVPSSGSITSNVYLRDTVNSEWEDGTSALKPIVWTITAKVMTVPTFTETLVYTGEKFRIAEHLNFYDPVITVYGSQIEASNAGIYRANLRLPTENGGKNYVWNNTEFNGTVEWQIQKKEIYLNWDKWSYLYNNQTHSPRATISFGLVDADASLANEQNSFVYTGDADAREPGSYKIDVLISSTSDLYNNYTLAKDSATFYWVIKENANEVVITVVWDIPADGGYTFNDAVQAPKIKALYSENVMGEANIDDYEIHYTGDYQTSKWRGSYTVGVEITAVDGTPVRVRQGECSYVIRTNQGQGVPPTTIVDPEEPGDKPAPGTVWLSPQTIISAVSLVLVVVFTIMTLNYVTVMNDAKKKTKKLAQISYSFAPAGLLALSLPFGLGSGAWWGVAATLMALAVLTCATMIIFRKKSRKALAALAEEQERVEEEKEAAREAEQQRRDNEFKMMFAAMQQNYQQPQVVGYDEMQNMISSAVAGLLPAMQQQLQALPPAQAQAPAQNSEADELRAMMAQQQEMLNQLMQNQQAAYASAPAQDNSAKTVFDTQVETEVVSLEESYGKLSEDEKRYYYEIGGYIMSKPETSQNDGKYAVLFKYRGRTLFKLSIKNNAPVLAYALDNNSQAEMIIDEEDALEDAKQIVNLRMKSVDRELGR